jgi:acetyl-CoA C-acetyltransferase
MSEGVFLAGAGRTAIGSFCGALADCGAAALGSAVVNSAVERAGIGPDRIDQVILGNVIGAGLGQNVARQAAIGAGIPYSVPACTLNKVCGSGMYSVMLAAQAIRCGDSRIVVAGGTESMTQAPYLLPKARTGYRMGHGELTDSLIRDGLWDVYHGEHMGVYGDRCAEHCRLSREDQDEYAIGSYERALQSQQRGWFSAEIVPVSVPGRKGDSIVSEDEEPQRFNEPKLRALRPAFDKDGTVTAGNASSVNDGAAAMVVVAEGVLKQESVRPLARIVGCSSFSREPEWFTLAPIGAIQRLLKKIGWRIDDIDLFEVNEAFSAVPLAAMRELDIPRGKMNIQGGAVALGHPIGASGARILVTLLHAMHRVSASRGVASLCIGGGEAVAVAVERC